MTTRVLIIDDSALMRQLLTALLSEDPDIALADELRDKVKAAASTRVSIRPAQPKPRLPQRQALNRQTGKILMIGASTGGVEALKTLLMDMPPDCPPTLITQHMPERFTAAFAN